MRASPLEITWTAVACLGFAFSMWLAISGARDLLFVRSLVRHVPPLAKTWGPRWWLALFALTANVALCFVWAGFIGVGLIAMQFPPPPPTSDQAVSNMWAGWSLITMEMLLAAVQGWHLYVRRQVDAATPFHTKGQEVSDAERTRAHPGIDDEAPGESP